MSTSDTPIPLSHNDKTRPSYYMARGISGFDVIEAFNLSYHLGTAAAYILRAGKKPGESELDDLRKARAFLTRRIDQLEKLEAQQAQQKPPVGSYAMA